MNVVELYNAQFHFENKIESVRKAYQILYFKLCSYLLELKGCSSLFSDSFSNIQGYCYALYTTGFITYDDYYHFLGICIRLKHRYLKTI